MKDKLMVIIGICALILSGWMTSKVWTLGGDEEDYEIICLGGHEYWRANFAAKGFLAVRLTSNGKPSSCSS